MYCGSYVDVNLLEKGIYTCTKPHLYDMSETIETLIFRAEKIQDMTGKHHVSDTYFENLKQCEMVSIVVSTKDEIGNLSDGYHTFNELYEIRKAYNAALFNAWFAMGYYNVHKSVRHHDGEYCFGGGWFIVVAVLPTGQISNHYELKDWNLFKIPAKDKALFEYDGHNFFDVISRLNSI